MLARVYKRSNLIMFVFVVVVFGLLSLRSEHQASYIREKFYESCVTRNINVDYLNRQNRALWESEINNKVAAPDVKAKRLHVYATVLKKADCGKRP